MNTFDRKQLNKMVLLGTDVAPLEVVLGAGSHPVIDLGLFV